MLFCPFVRPCTKWPADQYYSQDMTVRKLFIWETHHGEWEFQRDTTFEVCVTGKRPHQVQIVIPTYVFITKTQYIAARHLTRQLSAHEVTFPLRVIKRMRRAINGIHCLRDKDLSSLFFSCEKWVGRRQPNGTLATPAWRRWMKALPVGGVTECNFDDSPC